MPKANRLINESSPYLQQHAHNPVDWYPWGEDAFLKARKEDKPVIISVGYSSCHWCHVMEEESFEDIDAARLMNESFVCIKVDREERPDIDTSYMNALQLITGQGGWPMNMFALPDGRPFYGGTYFPKSNWIRILKAVSEQYSSNRENILNAAESIDTGVDRYRLSVLEPADVKDYGIKDLKKAVSKVMPQLDRRKGGISGVPKFPMPVFNRFLLAWSYLQNDEDILNYALMTLDSMAAGGIYDQIGGGFARYSTDGDWRVPHFEKMLYDNAQLVSLFSDAYKVSGKERYKDVVIHTLEFIKREMASPEGVFYSALDADSEGREGLYYIWKEEELKLLLKEDYDLAADVFRIGKEGLWEDGYNILLMPEPERLSSSQKARLENIRRILMANRIKRTPPGLDDKSLTSWNGMMIKAYADAYKAFADPSWLKSAVTAADFILDHFIRSDGGLFHAYKDGKAYIGGFLEDYAHLADGLISLYEAGGNPEYLNKAAGLMEIAIEDFYSEDHRILYSTVEGDSLLNRDMEIIDTTWPSANGVSAHNLFRLARLTGSSLYAQMAEDITDRMSRRVLDNPLYLSHWAELMLYIKGDFFELVTAGPDAEEIHRQLTREYLPHTVLAFSTVPRESDMLFRGRCRNDRTQIFVCRDNSCGLPFEKPEEALKQIFP